MSDADYAHLDNATEREWLTNVSPSDVLKNAHRIYEFMAEAGVPADSYTREMAFGKASDALIVDYEVLYQAWLNQKPVTDEELLAITDNPDDDRDPGDRNWWEVVYTLEGEEGSTQVVADDEDNARYHAQLQFGSPIEITKVQKI